MDSSVRQFLDNVFSAGDYKVYSLAGDASSRKYHRVIKDQNSMVLMQWEPFNPDNYPFLSVLNHFANYQVGVPQVIAMSPETGFVLLEDLGDLTLERKFSENQNPENSIPFYKQALDEIIKIHFPCTVKATALEKDTCTAFKIQFDVEKFTWELNYALEHLIKGICQYKLTPAQDKEIALVFNKIAQTLHDEPKFISHRDYHSRNLMIKLDQMRVIDFQDARLGPVQYDLVSLLRDSYVNIPDSMAQTLIGYYLDQSRDYLPKNFSLEQFNKIYEVQTIQRCFKACGSFSSFYMLRQDKRYTKYISHTLTRVLKSLTQFSDYQPLTNLLIDSGALDKKYETL